MSARPACRRCGAILSAYRVAGEPEDLCAACTNAQAAHCSWRVLQPEELVLAVAGILTTAAAIRPEEKIHVQAELETLGVLADHVDVHLAIAKLRRRYAWQVEATAGRQGYRLEAWPFRFQRRRQAK